MSGQLVSSGDAPAQAEGPLLAGLRARLLEEQGLAVDIRLARRSPLGRAALRLSATSAGTAGFDKLADRLGAADWVDSIAPGARAFYLRPTRACIKGWSAGAIAIVESAHARAEAALATAELSESQDLGERRRAVMLRGARCLRPDGAVIDPGAIGPVDIARGRLRARCGGLVGWSDLLGYIDSELIAGRDSGSRYLEAETAAAFLFLRTERARHVQLGVPRDGDELGKLADISRLAGAGVIDSIAVVTEFWFEVEGFCLSLDRAISAREPALVLRAMTMLAEKFVAEPDAAGAPDPQATRFVTAAARLSLGLCGCSFSPLRKD